MCACSVIIRYGLRGLLTQWLMTLYVTALPQETVCRIWDNLFCHKLLGGDGSKILLRVALALFGLHEKELLKLHEPTACAKLLREKTAGFYDGDRLIRACFERKLARALDGEAGDALLAARRDQHGEAVRREHEEVEERRRVFHARQREREARQQAAEASAAAAPAAAPPAAAAAPAPAAAAAAAAAVEAAGARR
eukprot:COSAG05_NODE_1576_length_4506_cov_7.927687_6_plen_195_part_00